MRTSDAYNETEKSKQLISTSVRLGSQEAWTTEIKSRRISQTYNELLDEISTGNNSDRRKLAHESAVLFGDKEIDNPDGYQKEEKILLF